MNEEPEKDKKKKTTNFSFFPFITSAAGITAGIYIL